MDKKSIIGLVLIGVIMFGYTWYSGKQNEKYQAEKARIDSINRANAPVVEQTVEGGVLEQVDTAKQEENLKAQLGEDLFVAQHRASSTFTIENDLADRKSVV